MPPFDTPFCQDHQKQNYWSSNYLQPLLWERQQPFILSYLQDTSKVGWGTIFWWNPLDWTGLMVHTPPGWDASPSQDTQHKVTWRITTPPGWYASPSQDSQHIVSRSITTFSCIKWLWVSVVVQFYPWFNFCFQLFLTHQHTLPYTKQKTRRCLQAFTRDVLVYVKDYFERSWTLAEYMGWYDMWPSTGFQGIRWTHAHGTL